MLNFFRGSATAMITPFTAEGKVNFEAFGRMIEYQIENGTDALVVLGTTGEPATMTEEEKEDVMRFSKERAAGRVRLIFGSGSNCTAHAVEASVKAQKLGADGLLVVTPYYNKCTQNGLYEYYKAVCEAVDIPVICYNVPPRTGVNIQPATMGRIAEIPNVAGIKEACGNMEQIMHTAREAHLRRVQRAPPPDETTLRIYGGGRVRKGVYFTGRTAALYRSHVLRGKPHSRQGGGGYARAFGRRSPRSFNGIGRGAQGGGERFSPRARL